MTEWPEVPFADAIDFQEGPGIMAADFRDQGVPLIRLAGLERGGSVLTGCNFLDPSTVRRRWAHFALREGDILLSSSVSLGRIAGVGPDAEGAIPYTGIIRMRPRDERVHAPFIRYLLEAPDFQRQAEIAGVGSVMRYFGPMHLRQMTVRLPPLGTQRRITEVLGALDDKIELNRRTSETLEGAAQALFKSWFLDSEPDASDQEGSLADAVHPQRDLVGPQLEPDTVFQHYSLPACDAGREAISETGAGIRSSKLAVPRGSVLLSKLNPEIERVWLPDIKTDDRAICSTEFLVLRPCVGVGRAFVYEFLRSAPFRSTLTSLVTGTTGSHQRAHAAAILQVPLRLPGPSRAAHFERIVGPMLDRVAVARRESRTLVALRDALLPRLLSGETSPSFGRGQGA